MSTNLVKKPGYRLSLACTYPASAIASGMPVRYGTLTGVAMTNGDANNVAVVDLGPGVYNLSCQGTDGGNAAIAVGDGLWFADSAEPRINKVTSGYFFGIALGAVGSGLTATIPVLHIPSPGSGNLAAGSIGATQLASNAVTTAKIAALNVTAAKMAAGAAAEGVDGSKTRFMANAMTTPVPMLIYRIDQAAGANADTDIVLDQKIRVVDVWVVLTGAGVASSVCTLKSTANPISDAMATAGSQKAVVRCATIDATYHEIAAGGRLRITGSAGASQPALTAYVLAVPIA
jgi:hypothetical protein